MSEIRSSAPLTLLLGQSGTHDDYQLCDMKTTTTTGSASKARKRLKDPPLEQALAVPRLQAPPPMTTTTATSTPTATKMPCSPLSLKRLGAFSKPSVAYHHSQTGLVHGRVYVQPRDRINPDSVHFCLQTEENQDDLSLHLVAHKEGRRRYSIYDASKGMDESWQMVAVVERQEFHSDSIAYVLTTTADDKLDACVFFNTPSLIQFALQGAPRQMEMGLFTKAGRELDHEQAYQVLKDCCKYSESKATSSAYKIVGDSKYLTVHQSLLPYKKEGSKKFGLNFRGRGRGASNKNCQMVNEVGKMTLQMVKYEKGIYHLDYAAPMNAVQAFGFALAQLDL